MIEKNNEISVVRNKQGKLEVTFSSDQPADLYWTTEANAHTNNKTLIGKALNSPVIFDDPLNAKSRIYLIYSWPIAISICRKDITNHRTK